MKFLYLYLFYYFLSSLLEKIGFHENLMGDRSRPHKFAEFEILRKNENTRVKFSIVRHTKGKFFVILTGNEIPAGSP